MGKLSSREALIFLAKRVSHCHVFITDRLNFFKVRFNGGLAELEIEGDVSKTALF